MAINRRRSRSAVAGGLGPFGIFLTLAVIGLLIQYWWVLLITLGALAFAVAIVRLARTPARPPRERQPKSVRPPKPGPNMTQRNEALVSEGLEVQMRAIKQAGRIRDMQEWDYEWIRLTHPEKSSQELTEIAKAQLARRRSIGVNYERARLLDSAPEQGLESSGESLEDQLHEALVAQIGNTDRPASLIEGQSASSALIFSKARKEAGELLAGDPRTMWAWSEYLKSRHCLPVNSEDARQILAVIPSGDHVEIFAPIVISPDSHERGTDELPREARFAAMTFNSWILPSLEQAEIIPYSETKRGFSSSGSMVDPIAEIHFRVTGGKNLRVYSDRRSDRFFSEGVGGRILRLPDSPLAPAPPELGTGVRSPSPEPTSRSRLLGDWHTAEDVALWHMSGPLGFFGSRLTGGVSDRGVDVEHPEAVAQVKMQATPVGSPQIRQLRGARPRLTNHVFYSTSGFTKAATVEAADSGVALFIMDDDARVRPHGAHAKRLTLEGHQRQGGDDALVAEYVSSVVDRVHKAKTNYGNDDSRWALRETDGADRDRLYRAESYLKGAVADVKRHPRIGVETHKAVISHFRNADLRAAFFCHVLGLPYPGDEPLSPRRPPTAADFD